MGFSKCYTTERNKKSPNEVDGTFHDNRGAPGGTFYRLSTGRAAYFENIKPHNPSTKDWYIPADMEEGDYLMMDPACEVKKKAPGERMMGMKS